MSPPGRLRDHRSITTLILLFTGCGCIYILPYLSAFLYIPMKDAMHLDNTQISLMGSAMGVTAMICYWPGGWIADRFSVRKLIVFSLIANGSLGFWLATLPSFKELLIIQLLLGVFVTLTYWSAVIKMVRQLGRSDQQARCFGIFEGGRNITAVAALAAGMYLFDRLGGSSYALRATIVLISAMLLAIGALSWMYLPEITAPVETSSADNVKLSLRVAVARVIRIPAIWLTTLIILCAYATYAGTNYFTPYATDVYGQSVVFGGVLAVISQATGIFAPPLAGFIADRWRTSSAIAWLMSALAGCLLLFVIIPGNRNLFLLLLVNSISISIIVFALRGIYFALLEEGAIPVALTGTACGLISTVAYSPDVFMPAVAGHLLDRYTAGGVGYRYFFLITALFAACGAGFSLIFRNITNAAPALTAEPQGNLETLA